MNLSFLLSSNANCSKRIINWNENTALAPLGEFTILFLQHPSPSLHLLQAPCKLLQHFCCRGTFPTACPPLEKSMALRAFYWMAMSKSRSEEKSGKEANGGVGGDGTVGLIHSKGKDHGCSVAPSSLAQLIFLPLPLSFPIPTSVLPG